MTGPYGADGSPVRFTRSTRRRGPDSSSQQSMVLVNLALHKSNAMVDKDLSWMRDRDSWNSDSVTLR